MKPRDHVKLSHRVTPAVRSSLELMYIDIILRVLMKTFKGFLCL